MVKTKTLHAGLIAAWLGALLSCSSKQDMPAPQQPDNTQKKMEFDVSVYRDGQKLESGDPSIATKSGVDASDMDATMDRSIPFGLVAIDMSSRSLVLDNERVSYNGDGWSGSFDKALWSLPVDVTFSAYFPYVTDVEYGDELGSYSIPFTAAETPEGPLVSRTVERAVEQLNLIPLEFQHITDDIGYAIFDVTPDPQLQGLIHLRKVVAHNVAQAGVFLNDLEMNRGLWHKQGFYRKITVFEGDAKVGVGLENEKYIGADELVSSKSESSRYYAIPDDVVPGRQFVEVTYDVDGFTLPSSSFYYEPLKGQTARFSLYGLLPDNVMEYGKQYTFHLGLNLATVYPEITFAPSVNDWEVQIFEDNKDF